MKNIFAFTEPSLPDTGYVAYLSVNEIATESPQNIAITVRSRGDTVAPQEIRMTTEMCELFAAALLAYLNKKTP